jgi:hypothetical protein
MISADISHILRLSIPAIKKLRAEPNFQLNLKTTVKEDQNGGAD